MKAKIAFLPHTENETKKKNFYKLKKVIAGIWYSTSFFCCN